MTTNSEVRQFARIAEALERIAKVLEDQREDELTGR